MAFSLSRGFQFTEKSFAKSVDRVTLDSYNQLEDVLNSTIEHIERKHAIVFKPNEMEVLDEVKRICEDIDAAYKKDVKDGVAVLLEQLQKISEHYFEIVRTQRRTAGKGQVLVQQMEGDPVEEEPLEANDSIQRETMRLDESADTNLVSLFEEFQELIESMDAKGLSADLRVYKGLIVSLDAFVASKSDSFLTNINDLTKFIADLSFASIQNCEESLVQIEKSSGSSLLQQATKACREDLLVSEDEAIPDYCNIETII